MCLSTLHIKHDTRHMTHDSKMFCLVAKLFNRPSVAENILKEDFLAKSKVYLYQFCASKCAKIHTKSHKSCKNTRKHIPKIYDFSCLSVHISRFCTNSEKCCAVA